MNSTFDVIVAGGGPAGVVAAIAAARNGASTLLVERTSCAGGNWTSACMNLVFDFANKNGLIAEIRERLTARKEWCAWDVLGPDNPQKPAVFSVEGMKLLLDEMLMEAGVTVRYHSLVIDAEVVGKKINQVIVASKSGLEPFAAKIFIDCTGDGDLGAKAGCSFEKGRPEDGKMQPGTMAGLVSGWPEPLPDRREVAKVLSDYGYLSSNEDVTLFFVPRATGAAYLMATHLYGMDASSAESMSEAEVQGRKEIAAMVRILRESGDSRFADLVLLQSGPEIGVREGRRILGDYYLTIEDLRAGTRFDDGICEVTFNVDVHHVDPAEGHGLWLERTPKYTIPYRSLIARDLDNLLLAGRLISGDFLAHASYRVTADCAAMGEVAGRAAAHVATKGGNIREVPMNVLKP